MKIEEIRRNPEKFLNARPKEIKEDEWKVLLEVKPHLLKNLKQQTSELCKIAVKTNPNTLCLVRNQTEDVILTAIDADEQGIVLCYVREQTEKIVKAALKKNSQARYYVDEKFQYLI